VSDRVPGPVPATATRAAAEACPFINRDALTRALEAAWPALAEHAAAAERAAIRRALTDPDSVTRRRTVPGGRWETRPEWQVRAMRMALDGPVAAADASGEATTDEGNDPQ
jgi:hypothetical protein